ncbi:apolipoprotein N-acyltransferase [Sphingomonas oleivorans]|uniref:Apolipoprotein N-acyltransferase n=1 Tax=Sphingomonas oleivorans TaxID=1735121 RepID=A0A2T5FY18_9SPHN|nr:apolipoprotein N-acyltransferase [Sphingomonas oleivorans]PTQ11437.1 apolipoprotein N-acyltransferase [Sphingomonas oleivorans]
MNFRSLRPGKPHLLCFLLGPVSACGFAPLGLWPLTLAAFGGFLWMVREADGLRAALARGWWFGLGQFVLGLNWIATAFTYQAAMPAWLGWIAVVLLSLYLAVYPAIAAGLAWGLGRRSGMAFALLFGAAWIISEWLRATMFTGFAWNPLGVIWVGTPLAMVARFIGTYGLSGLSVALVGAAVPLAEAARRRKLTRAAVATLAIAATALILLPLAVRSQPGNDAGRPLIRIVQPNIGQEDKYSAELAARNFARLAALSGQPGAEPRLLMWPEAAVLDYIEEEPWTRARLASLLGPRDMLLTGGTALEYDPTGHVVAARNSLFAIDFFARILGRYDKAHLVPYGEYLPMRPILSAIGLSRLAPGDLDFWPGPGAETLAVPGFGKVGIQICYEIIFSGQVVDRANRPAFLFNPSNDAWFGAWGPPQHLAQARLRAIEEGLPVIRSTPTGISALIDADGRLIAHLPWRKAGAIDARLPRAAAPTPFARYGNVLPLLLAGLLALLAFAPRIKAR